MKVCFAVLTFSVVTAAAPISGQSKTAPRAQSRAGVAPKAHTSAELTNTSLRTDGLQNKAAFDSFYQGDFAHLSVEHASPELYLFFSSYLGQSAVSCPQNLPADKVPITVLAQNSRQPVPGEFARPGDESISVQLENHLQNALIARVLQARRDNDDVRKELSVPVQATASAESVTSDMRILFAQNSCDNPALDRLRNNMRLYATGRPGLRPSDRDPSPVIPDSAKAEAEFQRGEALLSQSTVDPKSRNLQPAPGCVEALRNYLSLAPNGLHAAKAKEYLSDFGLK